jgi:hypothetical protein
MDNFESTGGANSGTVTIGVNTAGLSPATFNHCQTWDFPYAFFYLSSMQAFKPYFETI